MVRRISEEFLFELIFGFFRLSMLKLMYCLSQGIGQILALYEFSLFSNQDLSTVGGYDSATHALSCLLMLGSVCLPNQLKFCIFGNLFAVT